MPSRVLALVLVSCLLAVSGCVDLRPPTTPAQPETEPGLAEAARPGALQSPRGAL